MAFIMYVETINGLVADNAYIQANTINGNKQLLDVEVRYFKNKEAADESSSNYKPPFLIETISFTPSVEPGAPNYHKQFYEWAKSTPQFENAIDDL